MTTPKISLLNKPNQQRGNIHLGFFCYFELFASQLLENIEKVFCQCHM